MRKVTRRDFLVYSGMGTTSLFLIKKAISNELTAIQREAPSAPW